MNVTETKYYVYTQCGLLINRIVYAAQVEKYGDPINCSSNGLNYIFKKQESFMHNKDKDLASDQNLINMRMTFSVMMLTVYGMVHLKNINIYKRIQEYFGNNNKQRNGHVDAFVQNYEDFKDENEWLFPVRYQDHYNEVEIQIDISDE